MAMLCSSTTSSVCWFVSTGTQRTDGEYRSARRRARAQAAVDRPEVASQRQQAFKHDAMMPEYFCSPLHSTQLYTVH